MEFTGDSGDGAAWDGEWPEMESERERDAVWDGEWARERRGLRWSEQERDETKEIKSEREAKDKFVNVLF